MSTEPATTPAPRRRGLPTLLVVLGLLIVVGIWFVTAGNRLVALQENVNTSWAQVETVLQRRFDLIPNLVNTVKGYAEHEKEILEEVTRPPQPMGSGQKRLTRKPKQARSSKACSRGCLSCQRTYPDLRRTKTSAICRVELSGTENRVAVERERYNEVVRTYNTAVRQFPASLVASVRGFTTDKPYFEGSRSAQEAPKVDFSKPEK